MSAPTTEEVIVLGVLMPIFDVAAVSLRMYLKRKIRRLAVDDVFILLATVYIVVRELDSELTEHSLCWLDAARSA